MKNRKEWLRAAGIRALKTVAQAAAASIGVAAVLSDVDWVAVVSSSLLAGILSLLTSLAGLPEVPEVREEPEDAKGWEEPAFRGEPDGREG